MKSEEQIRNELFALQDKEYHNFHAKLVPNLSSDEIIGIRTPVLRKYAASIAGTVLAEEYLTILPHTYYEENNLHAMLIASMKDYKEIIRETERFLPYIDNWATCDLPPSKVLAKHLPELIEKCKEWMASSHTYTIRYGLEMLMRFYLEETTFQAEYLEHATELRSDEYYVNMMIAWFFATALAKQYDATIPYLQEYRLDIWVHNKTIQKAVESYRITKEQKEYLRTLKMK